jgi:NADH-quinone oxidoreductase subunit M
MNLNLLILIPLLTALALLAAKSNNWVRWIALAGSAIQLILCCFLCLLFVQQPNHQQPGQFLFGSTFEWYADWHIYHSVAVDGISIAMLLMTALVVLAGVLVSWQVSRMTKEFFFLLMLLAMGAYGFFLSTNLFVQFFFLELAVIPKFLLIGIWGSGRKDYSATKLALMLMGASAQVFVAIAGLYIYQSPAHSFDLQQLLMNPVDMDAQKIFFPFAFVGFGIFTALFPFHTWVPDGHASAPTAASMFLAGISMKLGGYGCLRMAVNIMPDAAEAYSPYIMLLAAVAILYGAFATMMQTDLKYINAYSSVSHCGFVLLGIGMLTRTGLAGAVVQMVSHGLMTALFFAVIGMIYERTHTREVKEMGGLLKCIPFISTVFVIAGLTSLGLPGFSGFVGEMMVFVGGWERIGWLPKLTTLAAAASIVVTAVYILQATGRVLMGPAKQHEWALVRDAGWNEKAASLLLIAGILLIGLAPVLITSLVMPGTEAISSQLKTIVAK